MDNEYNFYNLEAPFRLFLNSGNKKISPISINNYLSDLRHFFGWIVLTIKNRSLPIKFASDDYQQILSQFMTEEMVRSYADYLRANNIPVRTINRRLSTLRKFCSFCISQGWIKTNPAKIIVNVTDRQKSPLSPDPLADFSEYVMKSETDQNIAKTLLDDLKEFFVISSNQ